MAVANTWHADRSMRWRATASAGSAPAAASGCDEAPEKIAEEIGNLFARDEPLPAEGGGGFCGIARKRRPPSLDDTSDDM
jgi:hypothetical protein